MQRKTRIKSHEKAILEAEELTMNHKEKRRRSTPSRFDNDFLDNEEQRLIQQV